MLDIKNIIQAINKALEPFFIKDEGSYLSLSPHKSRNVFRLKPIDGCSDAYDDYGSSGDSVKVVKWFSDYWLFVEIKFHDPKGALITLSVFHFAMNGDWSNTSVYIHSVNNEKNLAQWFGGLLGYLKTELDYIDKKRSKKIY